MLLLLLIFIVVPIAELYVIIQVGEAIGALPTVLILLADAILGSMLLRHQGRAAWIRFNRALAEGRLPHKEVFDGVLIILGGALLITPGFLTDILGLILLIPPTRAAVRAIASRTVRRRLALGGGATMWTFGRSEGRPRRDPPVPPSRGGPGPDDIEGTGHEVRDEDELPPGREPFPG